VSFVLSLWRHQRVAAMAYLKAKASFWKDLSAPLLDKQSLAAKVKVNTVVLRIIAAEVSRFASQTNSTNSSALILISSSSAIF
jgi:hypothetical protein